MMAIPDDRTSSLLIDDYWLPPDDLETNPLLVYEMGGIGLNDSSSGLRYQPWTLRLVGDDFVISAPNWPETVLFTRSDVTELDLAFDQNMQPFVCFVEAGQPKFYWWDTNIAAFTFTNLPADALTPRCCLDDKRETQTDASDIVLCYVKDDDIKARYQRDRYTIEYTIHSDLVHPITGGSAVLVKVGMNAQNRLQWLCTDPAMNEVC